MSSRKDNGAENYLMRSRFIKRNSVMRFLPHHFIDDLLVAKTDCIQACFRHNI
ncbi:hypothetical protein CEV31_2114 [Brucella thiophenivorans]|uniref:Uncharacterized protein n=1 Tax=Brucella thiophenivorans TaxID=571255 RepID=A0A256FV82_9HYPH|nr:hypothetical protein CEV31_2114 [Brucella thiophenivorans]